MTDKHKRKLGDCLICGGTGWHGGSTCHNCGGTGKHTDRQREIIGGRNNVQRTQTDDQQADAV